MSKNSSPQTSETPRSSELLPSDSWSIRTVNRIDRALASLDDALRRCRTEDVRYGLGISAALDFLELHARERWPFEQFRKPLEDFSTDGVKVKAEGRWQVLNAALKGTKRVIPRAE